MAQRKLKLNEIRAHLKAIHGLIAESDAAMGAEAEDSPPDFEGKPENPAMDDGSGLSAETRANLRRFGIIGGGKTVVGSV
jgi:hypothetical protein